MNGRPLFVAAALGLPLCTAASAQSLEARVAAAPDGDVRFAFTSRPDVDDDWGSACDSGPVRVTLRRRAGRLTGLRVAVAGRGATVTGTDLGRVPTRSSRRTPRTATSGSRRCSPSRSALARRACRC